MTKHYGPQVPIGPIREWCVEQVRIATAGRSVSQCAAVADRLGINVRILNRILRGMYAGSRNYVKGEYPTETISRDYVEDMLTRAGVDFYDLYPDLEGERDIELEPDGWCKCCREFVTPIGGVCPWDDTPVDVARAWAA